MESFPGLCGIIQHPGTHKPHQHQCRSRSERGRRRWEREGRCTREEGRHETHGITVQGRQHGFHKAAPHPPSVLTTGPLLRTQAQQSQLALGSVPLLLLWNFLPTVPSRDLGRERPFKRQECGMGNPKGQTWSDFPRRKYQTRVQLSVRGRLRLPGPPRAQICPLAVLCK